MKKKCRDKTAPTPKQNKWKDPHYAKARLTSGGRCILKSEFRRIVATGLLNRSIDLLDYKRREQDGCN